MTRSSHAGWRHVAVLAAYALLTILMTWPLVLNINSAIPGDGFDGWQNYWNLWWIKVALIDRISNPLITDLLYHPTGVGLYFHTLNPFNGLLTLPIQLTSGLIAAYNAVVFFSWVMGGYGVFLLTLWILTGKQKPQYQGSRASAAVAPRPTPHAPLPLFVCRRRHLHLLTLSHGPSARPHAGDELSVDSVLHPLSATGHDRCSRWTAMAAQFADGRTLPGLRRSV